MSQSCPHCGKPSIPNFTKASMGLLRLGASSVVRCPECGTRLAASRLGAFAAWLPMAAYAAWVVVAKPYSSPALAELFLVSFVSLYLQIRVVKLVELPDAPPAHQPTRKERT